MSPRTQDVAIAALATAFLVVELCTSASVEGPLALNLLVYVPTAASLVVRRRRPLVTAAVVFVGYSIAALWLTDITQLNSTMPPVLLSAYAGGRYAADLRPMLVLAALTIVTVNIGAGAGNPDNWIVALALYGSAILTGRALRNQALVAAELAERTERLAIEQDLRAAEAAVDERRRIARELHDVVAHTLSVMVVQAGAARRTLGRDADRSEEALETVEATGRAALVELRRLLGFVGEGADAAHPAPRDPQPTTADLAALAKRAGAAGLPTQLVVDGAPGDAQPLPAGAEVAIYRIAQEALTNAIKHAGPGATAVVTLRWGPERLELEVRDDGRGAVAPAALPSGGHGLIGMRERVGLFGGELHAGPAPDGGFRILARLPRSAVAAVPA